MNDDFYKLPGFYYLIIASNDQLPVTFKSTASKRFSIPCLVACYKYLLKLTQRKQFFFGEVVSSIDEAVNYNEQHQSTFEKSKRKLPNIDCVFTKSIRTQTEFLPTFMIDRFYTIFKGGLYGELCKIFRLLNSGYECLHVDNKLILIK